MNEDEKQPVIDKAEQLGPTAPPADEVTHDDDTTFSDGSTYA